VSGAPEQPDPAAFEQASFLADESRHGHDVIRVSGVLEAKKEA
jgi:hypothetical protein